MGGGVRWYLVGSLVLVLMAGCGRGFMFEERDAWRHDAEVACLKSGAVRESAGVVRIAPIEGPGICGADFPLRVATIGGHGAALGFAGDPPRPPGAIPGALQPPWPIKQPRISAPTQPVYTAPTPPVYSQPLPPPANAPSQAAPYIPQPQPAAPGPPMQIGQPLDLSVQPSAPPVYSRPLPENVPLSPPQYTGSVAPVEIKPAATLACPIVSVLDQWVAQSVQPAARRWFGQQVVEIKQISAYSCRSMNNQPNAKISEHAFGNAIDIAAFVLADGRTVKVKDGWRGRPEEQGFLRDVQSTACEHFNTVLAPGADAFHYDHIHVDLMRRPTGRRICLPAAVGGEAAAAAAQQRNPSAPAYQNKPAPTYTPIPGVPPPIPRNGPIDEKNDPYAWRGADLKGDDALTTGTVNARTPVKKRTPADYDWIEDDGPRPPVR